jgi:hypothetical protein
LWYPKSDVSAGFLALLLAAATPRVQVDSAGDGDCPDARRIEEILANRPGNDDAAVGASWRLRLRPVSPVGPSQPGTVDVALIDPLGVTRLGKLMPVGAADCDAAVAAAVAIVDRFFRGVAWSSDAPLPPPAPHSDATATAGPRAIAFGVTAGAATWLSDHVALRPSAGARLDAPRWHARLDVQTLLPSDHRTQVVGGTATASEDRLPVRAALAWARAGKRLGWQAGLDALTTYEQAQSQGVTQPASKSRLALALGVGVGIGIRLAARWQIIADAAIYHRVSGRRFYIADNPSLPGTVLESPVWQALFGLRLGFAFGQ